MGRMTQALDAVIVKADELALTLEDIKERELGLDKILDMKRPGEESIPVMRPGMSAGTSAAGGLGRTRGASSAGTSEDYKGYNAYIRASNRAGIYAPGFPTFSNGKRWDDRVLTTGASVARSI